MIITLDQAKKMMADDGAFVRRFEQDGTELASATSWSPDPTWATCTQSGQQYAIVENPATQVTHHVAL